METTRTPGIFRSAAPAIAVSTNVPSPPSRAVLARKMRSAIICTMSDRHTLIFEQIVSCRHARESTRTKRKDRPIMIGEHAS